MEVIRTATTADWNIFFRLAEKEGWRISPAERQLFQGPWASYARTLEADGRLGGFVTAVAHQRSGWIGNLIVPTALRGRGYGRRLFAEAAALLDKQRVQSLWLTASEQGRPLYEQFGFKAIDRIERWVRAGGGTAKASGEVPGGSESLLEVDRVVWGESRSQILTGVAGFGQSFADEDSIIFLQNTGDLQILGPWYSRSYRLDSNRILLAQALATARSEVSLVVDLIASSPLRPLLAEAGFAPAGRSELMVRGDWSAVLLEQMVSLASLGSVG